MSKSEQIPVADHQAHDHHQDLFDREWKMSQENPMIKGLKSGQKVEEILEEFPDFKKAFKTAGHLEELMCSDGRVTDNSEQARAEELKTAGECILYDKSQLAKFIKENSGKIKVVTSHDGCGAAAIKYAEMQKNGEVMPAGVTSSDELGRHFAQQLASALGADYRHIGQAEFSSEVHNERLLVLDGTAKFRANQVKDFPARYVSAALGLGEKLDYVAKEAETLANISLGDHGFNSRFNAENPFYVMIIAQDEKQLKAVRKSLAAFVERALGRVQVLGTIAPV